MDETEIIRNSKGNAMTVKSLFAALPLANRPLRKTNLLTTMLKAASIRRERQCLKGLDEHILKDIGVSRIDADVEASRPVWDAPSRWFL